MRFISPGTMSGILGTGALTALDELGYRNAFDEVYSFSAGFPNAAYFLAGQAALSTTVYADNLVGRAFINWFTPWHVADVNHLLEVLQFKKRLDVETALHSQTKLYVWLKNCALKTTEFIEARPKANEDFFKLLRAAVTMEYLTPGTVEYQGQSYKDPSTQRRFFLPSVFQHSQATDFLVIYNRPNQKIVGTPEGEHIFEIIPEPGLSRFETNPKQLLDAAQKMQQQVHDLFV